jgi:hypothetical protein
VRLRGVSKSGLVCFGRAVRAGPPPNSARVDIPRLQTSATGRGVATAYILHSLSRIAIP